MKRPFVAACFLLTFGCSKESERSEQDSSRTKTTPTQAKLDAHQESVLPARIILTAGEFHTSRALDHLSKEQERIPSTPQTTAPVVVQEKPKEAADVHPPIRFTRVAGGDGFFCGTTFEGAIQCWGSRNDRIEGKFVDLAIGEDGLCQISNTGALTCETPGAPSGLFTRVHAGGENYCALTTEDEVRCWGGPLTPPAGLKADFFTVGGSFACAADLTRRLVCWGDTMPLMLPIDPPRVKDIAAGNHFLCALLDDGTARCFGQGPRLPDDKYSSVNAGFDQVCALAQKGGLACVGGPPALINGDIRRIAVAKHSLCAHLTKNELECVGSAASGQLNVPLDMTKKLEQPTSSASATEAVSPGLWIEFLELFPQQKRPFEFRLHSKLSLGDRIPAKFEAILGKDPNRYRSGVGFELPHDTVGLTLFDLEERALHLFLFRDRRRIDDFVLLKWNQKDSDLIEAPDGTGAQKGEALSRVSEVMDDGTIETEELSGIEKKMFVKAHIDGRRPIASIDCQIQRTTWVNHVTPSGKSEKKTAKVALAYGAVDLKGCKGQSPFR